jgi:rubredoxin
MNCPSCKSNWEGDLIPTEYGYPPGTKWERQIDIDGGFLGIYDGVVAVRCPDCGGEFPRNDSGWAKEMFDRYIKVRNN